MTQNDKIVLAEKILEMFRGYITTEEIPLQVGYLNKEFGVNGFVKAEIGHPVFEYKDRYLIYLESKTPDKISGHGAETHYKDFKIQVPFYKETLKNYINFN